MRQPCNSRSEQLLIISILESKIFKLLFLSYSRECGSPLFQDNILFYIPVSFFRKKFSNYIRFFFIFASNVTRNSLCFLKLSEFQLFVLFFNEPKYQLVNDYKTISLKRVYRTTEDVL